MLPVPANVPLKNNTNKIPPTSQSRAPSRASLRKDNLTAQAKSNMAATGQSRSPTSKLEEILSSPDRIEELSDTDSEYEDVGYVTGPHDMAHMEYINSVTQPIRDAFSTKTSKVQDETLEELLPYLEGNPADFPLNSFGLPQLQRQKHIAYLKKSLRSFPAQFVALDAARPWLVYWSLQGLTALGYDISEYQQR